MTGPLTWQGLDHTALHEAVVNGGLGPAVSMDAEQQWRRMGKLITEIEGRLSAAVRESESEWTGAAADAARTGISPLGRWAVDAAQDAANTAEAVTAHAYGAATLRRQLRDNPPVPPETIMQALERNATYGPQGATPADLAVVQAEQARRDEAAAKAVADARVYENIGFESRRTLDFWSVPPTVTVEPAAGPGGGPSGAGGPVGPTVGAPAEVPVAATGRAGDAPGVGGAGGAGNVSSGGALLGGGAGPGGEAGQGGGTGRAGGNGPGGGAGPIAGTGPGGRAPGDAAGRPGTPGPGSLGRGPGTAGAAAGRAPAAAPTGRPPRAAGRGAGSGRERRRPAVAPACCRARSAGPPRHPAAAVPARVRGAARPSRGRAGRSPREHRSARRHRAGAACCSPPSRRRGRPGRPPGARGPGERPPGRGPRRRTGCTPRRPVQGAAGRDRSGGARPTSSTTPTRSSTGAGSSPP
ncbi:hypothetical protein H6H00_27135 [Pseudonocardia petroleophila]|uniref:PPE family protein n=1 Tax=Pseudonocardia petroleophila TaxID=37331 RepID=A0A7G7MG24_9PSEU|nr:hypothetical protein [Pseudonocardia petroleophila]QNG51735.1 hypothetical protein H6H00_27135 [Pseudonocardia petroleophila]